MTPRVLIYDRRTSQWLTFGRPVKIFVGKEPNDVLPTLDAVEQATQQRGLWAAGFISYEAAPAFDPALTTQAIGDFPLIWFGLFSNPTPLLTLNSPELKTDVGAWQPALSRYPYHQKIDQIKAFIAAGDTYQVNFTFPQQATFSGNPFDLFCALNQPPILGYPAFIETDDFAICSQSPELFFTLDGHRIVSQPMKGTRPRGMTWRQDEQEMTALQQSEKDRAENVMIVDMIRNDLGRIAHVGSVKVEELFAVHCFPTVLQMISTVSAWTDVSFGTIWRALFPCASITGAPKVRTMQIINKLETDPRRIYTGSIGYMAPGRRAQFNVAIRTLLIDKVKQTATYGVGSGVVWDSDATAEYEECLLKAAIVSRAQPCFRLLETLLWTAQDGFFLLDRHLNRLRESAIYFGFPFEEKTIRNQIQDLTFSQPHKIRLLLDGLGQIELQHFTIDQSPSEQPKRLALAQKPIDIDNPFLYHKTTARQIYDTARAARPHCDDVILWNQRGELTETCIANIVLKIDGVYLTPPVECGLLGGTYRAELLASGRIREAILTREDLSRAEEIVVVNSVQKWRPAVLVPDSDD